MADRALLPRAAAFEEALAHHQANRLDAAETAYRRVLAVDPGNPHANNNLAVLLRATGRSEAAGEHYRRAAAAAPEDAGIRSNFACAMLETGRTDAAVAALREALQLDPDHYDACFNLGNCWRESAPERAAWCYQRAVRLRPDRSEAFTNLASLLYDRGENERAIELYRQAIRLQPSQPAAFANLGEALRAQGEIHAALAVLQEGVAQHPQHPTLHSNLLLVLHYSPWMAPEIVFRAHCAWRQRHAATVPAAPRRFANDRSAERPLRIGYVSPDFRHHPCANFSLPLLRAHDRAAVAAFCYPTSDSADEVTDRFRAVAAAWRPITGLDDAAAAAVIEQDRIDILVDLAGHTGLNRQMLFTRRPAPVQVTWLGYPDTTGQTAIDYRFTDGFADPEGLTDRWHTETLVRLPQGFLAYEPLAPVLPSPELPALARGGITFGSFNNLAKVTPELIVLWATLLLRLPDARLVLKSAGLREPAVRARIADRFAGQGVAAERLSLRGPTPHDLHLRGYDEIDIALDTFPYHGTTTSCEALWMGVPVVTLAGRTHVSRVGVSLLSRCGLDDLVAQDEAGYVAAAVALAQDLPRLAALRRTLPERLARSPLGDTTGFARTVESAYRTLWRRWLETA